MIMQRIICLTLLLAIWAMRAGAQSSASAPESLKLTTFTLPNGLTVYINEDPHAADVYGAVAVKGGGKRDPKDATGIAHYLEHMLFKGTDRLGTHNYAAEKPLLDQITRLYDQLGQTRDEQERERIQKHINELSVEAAKYAVPNEMDRLINRIGGNNVNAFTSEEAIVYFNRFPAHQIGPWLDLYAHRFQNPVFRLFQSELETVYEEKNRSMDNFGSVLFETFNKHFFKNHPYGQQTILGETEHLKNPSLSKMQAYFDTYYVPNNMALMLMGPIRAEEVRPLIEKHFGVFQPRPVPPFPEYPEAPFKGREVVRLKVSPIKLMIAGWRTVPANHPDELALEVCAALLNNSGETGLLDRLVLDNKVLAADVVPMVHNDHGGLALFVVPKLIGQSLADAEKLVLTQLDSLREGRFSDELFDAVRTNLIRDHELGLESVIYRGYMLLGVFIEGRSWNDVIHYGDRVRRISKADIQRVARQYLTSNYLVVESRMGFPKKDKLKKPPFVPVSPPENVKSEYARYFEQLPAGQPQPRFVDGAREVPRFAYMPGCTVFHANNPVNDLCSFKLELGLGEASEPLLSSTAAYLSVVGSEQLEVKQFKQSLYRLGYSYTVNSDDDHFTVSLTGPEDRLGEALALIRQLFERPARDEKALRNVKDQYRSQRKLETGEAASMASPLAAWVARGNLSPHLRQLDRYQLRRLTIDDLLTPWYRVQTYESRIHYTGRRNETEIRAVLANLGLKAPVHASNAPIETPLQTYSEPMVYFFPRRDARQSQLYFFAAGLPLSADSLPLLEAFNSYFGGDMSSLVFQEVREFRSLAYSAYGTYRTPKRPYASGYFVGYIGCQGDKTLESIEVMRSLIEHMPEKREREPEIRESLVQQAYAARPSFRNLTEYVANWDLWGYTQDPAQLKLQAYRQLQFDRLLAFYRRHLQGKPVVVAIVGNPRDVKAKDLARFGKVVKVRQRDFYRW
jgi:predicted Zn-dependent peptidase